MRNNLTVTPSYNDLQVNEELSNVSFFINTATQPVSVGFAQFDCMLESNENYSSDVTDFPVEDGYDISDHVINKAMTLDMVLYVTAMPITFVANFGGKGVDGSYSAISGRPDAVKNDLIKLRAAKTPITIMTPRLMYKNMMITNFVFVRTAKAGYSYEIPISFKEIITTDTKQIDVSKDYVDVKIEYQAEASKANAGAASVVDTASSGGAGGGGGEAVSEKGSSVAFDIFVKPFK